MARKDSVLAGGEVFSISLPSLGMICGVVSRPPNAETGLLHVYIRMDLVERSIKAEKIGLPHEWPAAWVGLVTTKSIVTGRWPVYGRIQRFEPDAFPIPPTRLESTVRNSTVWSIQTSADEPSLTMIDNISATKNEAIQFPSLEIVIAGSALEKSLVRHFRGMGFTFHDVPVEAIKITKSDIGRWNKHAKKVRAAIDLNELHFAPAGSKTDRNAKPGDWFGFPLPGGGFGVAILLYRPARHERVFSDVLVLSMRKRFDCWPTLQDVSKLTADDGAIMRQSSFISVRDGAWRLLGPHPSFDPSDWPWPLRWHLERYDQPTDNIVLTDSSGGLVMAKLDPKLRALDCASRRSAFDYGRRHFDRSRYARTDRWSYIDAHRIAWRVVDRSWRRHSREAQGVEED